MFVQSRYDVFYFFSKNLNQLALYLKKYIIFFGAPHLAAFIFKLFFNQKNFLSSVIACLIAYIHPVYDSEVMSCLP